MISSALFTLTALTGFLQAEFAPDFASRGASLEIRVVSNPIKTTKMGLLFSFDNTQNASSYGRGKNRKIAINTNYFADALDSDIESASLILCHEIGHQLGGTPLKAMNEFDAAEGQADYFATRVCMPRVLEKLYLPVIQSMTVDERSFAAIECAKAFSDELSRRVCIKNLQIALKTMQTNQKKGLDHDPFLPLKLITYTTPDTHTALATLTDWPERQCRLDTYLAGALNQARPACWFRP